MKISTAETNDVKVIRFDGAFDTNSASGAEKELRLLVEAGTPKLIINLEKTESINSTGLRHILATAQELKRIGGELVVCCLNEDVEEVFQISGYNILISVFPSETEAIKSFE